MPTPPSENLLSRLVVTEKKPAEFWVQQCSALSTAGVENFRATLQPFLREDNGEATNELMGTANRVLSILRAIAKKVGVTREACAAVLETLRADYHQAMVAEEKAAGMEKKSDPRHGKAHAYKSRHASCQAYAGALVPALEAMLEKTLIVNGDGMEPATAEES